MMEEGVVSRFPRGDDEETFEYYLSDPDKLNEFMAYCKKTLQDETLCFVVDVQKFELLSPNTAQQFNCGQEIFNQYLRTGAPQEVFVMTELIQKIQKAMAIAQDTKILPSTVFGDAKRQVVAVIVAESFPRFLATVSTEFISLVEKNLTHQTIEKDNEEKGRKHCKQRKR
jgi:hypothetical protein